MRACLAWQHGAKPLTACAAGSVRTSGSTPSPPPPLGDRFPPFHAGHKHTQAHTSTRKHSHTRMLHSVAPHLESGGTWGRSAAPCETFACRPSCPALQRAGSGRSQDTAQRARHAPAHLQVKLELGHGGWARANMFNVREGVEMVYMCVPMTSATPAVPVTPIACTCEHPKLHLIVITVFELGHLARVCV